MATFDALGITEIDHVEFAVADLDRAVEVFLKLGFEHVATRELRERKLRSFLLVQNQINILLSHSSHSPDPIAHSVAAHGEGVYSIAFRCKDAVSALEIAANRGARVTESPRAFSRDSGTLELASIEAFGDVRHTFISRNGTFFAEGFELVTLPQVKGFGLQRIDHVAINIEHRQLEQCFHFYEKVFGLEEVPLSAEKATPLGAFSRLLQSRDGAFTILINRPGESHPQIQEFIDIHHGPGVQHFALGTDVLFDCIPRITQEGIHLRAPYSEKECTLSDLATEKLIGAFFIELVGPKFKDPTRPLPPHCKG